MYAFLTSSLFLCVVVSLAAYAIGVYLHNKLENDLVNPLLIAIALVLVFLLVTGLPYKDYMKGSSYISFLLTPATICLAVPLYEQMKLLTRNFTAIIGGITTGMFAGLITVFMHPMSPFCQSPSLRLLVWAYLKNWVAMYPLR